MKERGKMQMQALFFLFISLAEILIRKQLKYASENQTKKNIEGKFKFTSEGTHEGGKSSEGKLTA